MHEPFEVCRASNKEQALQALKYLVTPFSSILDMHELNESVVDSSYHFNAIEDHDDVIACCFNGDLYVGNTNTPSVDTHAYLKVGEKGIKLITDDIRKGKKFFMDGCRAKSIKGSEPMLYNSNMTFWHENGVLWVTFPTDHDAVKWLMYNR